MIRVVQKFLLLVATSIAAFACVWTPGYGKLLKITALYNYWLIFAIFAFGVWFAWSAFKQTERGAWRGWMRANAAGFLVALVLGGLLQVHEPHRAKVLYDEDVVCGTAMMMHEERLAAFPSKMHSVDGGMVATLSATDKRPPFFAFVLSLVHDFTGYREGNVFFLNAALGVALLFALFLWAKPICGTSGAFAAMLLFSSLPLFAQNVTGAGFEVMNLFMVLLFALAARRYFEKPGAEGLNLFISVGLMLALVRYESILYLAALAGIVLIKWLREKKVMITWFGAMSPLLAASALVYIRIFSGDPHFAVTKTTGGAFYSLDYLAGNVGDALYFLFSTPGADLGNSLLLSLFGAVSLVILVVLFLTRALRSGAWNASGVVFGALAVTVAVVTGIFLFSCWGTWDDPMLARYSLSFQLLLVLSFASAVPFILHNRTVRTALPIVIAAYLLLFSIPQMARHRPTDAIDVSWDAVYFREWANRNATRRDLFIDESGVGLMLDKHAAISFTPVNQAPWKIQVLLDNGIYDHVYVCQRFRRDGRGGWIAYNREAVLTGQVKLKPLSTLKTRDHLLTQISEVTGVDDPRAAEHRPPADPLERARWLFQVLP